MRPNLVDCNNLRGVAELPSASVAPPAANGSIGLLSRRKSRPDRATVTGRIPNHLAQRGVALIGRAGEAMGKKLGAHPACGRAPRVLRRPLRVRDVAA